MASEKYALTPEHRAMLGPWAARLIANAMSTAPMDDADRAACRAAVAGMYAAAGLPAPRVVFVPSPFAAAFAAGFAASNWESRRPGSAADAIAATCNATDSAISAAIDAASYAASCDAIYAAINAATYSAIYSATRDATDAATRNATYAATHDATHAATSAAIRDATHDATYAATHDATYAATRAATYDATYAAINAAIRDATRDLSKWYVLNGDMRACAATATPNPELALRRAAAAWRMRQGGNQWSAWEAFLSFFQDVARLKLPEYAAYQHWRTLAERSGPRYVHREFCIVSDRPELLTVDAQNRPHNDDGPFCRWRDGSALYAVHGVRVPAWVVEHPDRITVALIEAERNQEIRRAMVGRYRRGQEVSGDAAYVRDAGGEIQDHDERWGTLRRRERPGDTPLVVLEVVNRTAEPDGTFKRYWLRCHPELRPMLPGGGLGAAQRPTALNAVASTFGLTGPAYARRMGALAECES